MRHVTASRAWFGAVVFLAAAAAPSRLSAGETASATAVKELTTVMAARQLDAMAAPDPGTPGRFVAALLVPNVQLLVVAAQYPDAQQLQSLVDAKQYRDVYSALHQPATQGTRVFFLDLGADGLQADDSDRNTDVLYQQGSTQTLFDGDWKAQKLSEDSYRKRFQEAEAEYSRILALLVGAMNASGTPQP